ncbi:MAG TPA: methyltransferase domain-containing protein [Gemmatimonadaceae bacterium]|nr:methyltransferase domain-containing protein [Gemmatimonadaceae bacterium]
MTSYELTRCIVCGEAITEEIAGPDDIRVEAELLWQFHMRRLSPRTPPERLVDRVAFSQPPPWRVVRCRACGLVYRNPVEKRHELREMYAADSPSWDALSALHEAQRGSYRVQARRLRRMLERRGSGLEVGSYVGAFLAAARAERWTFEGLDVNAGVNAFTRSLGFAVHDGDLESFHSDRTFDAVAIWNTFDQLPDPSAAVRAAARLLGDGGVLAIRVPNGECYASWRMRIAHGPRGARGFAIALLAYNNLLTFPYRFGFSPSSIARLLRDAGFAIQRVVGDVLVPTADEWTRRWAVLEERVVKPLTRPWKPWFEVYATRAATTRATLPHS